MAEKLNLQLFADGGAEGSAGTPAVSTENNRPGNDDSGANTPKNRAPEKQSFLGRGEAVNGAMGEQGDPRATEDVLRRSSDAGDKKTDIDRQKAYDDFIAENKDLHQAHIQNIFNKRFKDDKAQKETIAQQGEILSIIAQKYGIKDGDIEALRKAVEKDNSYIEEAAEREGLSPDQFREISRLRADAERNRKAEEERQAQSYIQQRMDGWYREAVEMKEFYPDFDFRAEFENVSFKRLLNAGIPMKQAYELVHQEEINERIREEAKKEVADNIRERQSRPSENGLKSSGGFVLGKDVSQLTKEERAELKRRARSGERIVL